MLKKEAMERSVLSRAQRILDLDGQNDLVWGHCSLSGEELREKVLAERQRWKGVLEVARIVLD